MSASNINSVVVNGRLTRDPKLYEPGGENVYAILRIAVNRRKSKGGQVTTYYDVKVWNGLAKACADHLQTGSLIGVRGRLDQYRSSKGGDPWIFIAAEEVEFCARPKGEAGESGDE